MTLKHLMAAHTYMKDAMHLMYLFPQGFSLDDQFNEMEKKIQRSRKHLERSGWCWSSFISEMKLPAVLTSGSLSVRKVPLDPENH